MINENQLFEVEIKSKAILREGKKSFITYFQGGTTKRIASNVRLMYPQFMKPEDKPMVNITKISQEEYNSRVGSDFIRQKAHLINSEVNLREIVGN